MQKKTRLSPLDSLLDENQRRQFADFLLDRVNATEAAMFSFVKKRQIYAKQMDDDFSWRGTGAGTRERVIEQGIDKYVNDIFDLQNDSLNIVGGFAAFMTARASDDIFGTDPFYALYPEGIEDQELTDTLQRHSEWKLRKTNFKAACLDAIDLAFGLGEGVVKQVWETETDVFETSAEVFHVAGQPMLTATGEYVTKDDNAVIARGEDGLEYLTLPDVDPSFMVPMDDTVSWEELAIEETNILFRGVRAATMHYADFLCDPTAPSLEESKFIGHRFQMSLSDAAVEYELTEEQIGKLGSGTEEPKTERDRPDADRGEAKVEAAQTVKTDPMLELVECWVKCDPKGDGRQRRIRAIVERSTQEILEMDYMANVTPNGELPFKVIRAYTVKNRWYGKGYYEAYEHAQEFIDRQLCRVEYRNRYHSNPAKLVQPMVFDEGEDMDEIALEPNKTYKVKAGTKPEEAVFFLTFPDLDERTWELMQFMIQVVQVRSGVTSAAQGEVSAMPSTATATGIESILASASVLARLPIGNLKGGLEAATLYNLKLIYANLDTEEAFSYFDGDVRRVSLLEPMRVPKNLEMNVKLLLTRFKQRENVESSTQAIGFFTQWIAVPEVEKGAGRSLFIQAIKGLGFDDADKIIRPPIEIPIDPVTGQPAQPMDPNAPTGGEAPPQL